MGDSNKKLRMKTAKIVYEIVTLSINAKHLDC